MDKIAEIENNQLSGANKAAVFMLSLGAENSKAILALMEDEEIRELSRTMATLGPVDAPTVEQLFTEFADQLSSTNSLLGTYDSTERLLLSSMEKEKVDLIMGEIRGPEGRTMWDKLGNVSEEILANFLKNEYPQTVAVILSKINPEHAARVLSNLPDHFSMEVVLRLLRMDNVHQDIIKGIEKTLRTEFMSNLGETSPKDSHEQIADILNTMDRATETRFMSALGERSKESATKIKELMFTFDDIIRIDSSGIQLLLREIEKDQLVIALKGAPDEIKKHIFENMSERAAKMVQEDMEAMGPVKISDVDNAQKHITSSAKTLSENGEIQIPGGSDEEELIY